MHGLRSADLSGEPEKRKPRTFRDPQALATLRARLRARLHDDQSVLVAVPLGALSKGSRGEASYALDLRGGIPSFIHISEGRLHDVNVLDLLIAEAGAFYVMDRGYLDFDRLYTFNQAGSFFVTRARSDFAFKRIYSQPVDRHTGLICDQTIELTVRLRRSAPDLISELK